MTQSQQVYAEQDGRAEPDAGTPEAPPFVKQYRALIAGGPDEKLPAEGILRDYLFKDSRKGRVFPVRRPRKGVKEAVLEYRISASAPAGSASLADVTLHTGRTHQIRAHLAYLGKPVLGDIKYGNRKMNERTGTRTQALCAVRISFLDIPEENTLHYLTGKVIKLKDPQIVKQFDALDKNKEGATSWQT